MKDIKMSDVFNLDGSIGFPAYWSDERVRAVDSIIRGHDKLKQERDEAIELVSGLIGIMDAVYFPPDEAGTENEHIDEIRAVWNAMLPYREKLSKVMGD